MLTLQNGDGCVYVGVFADKARKNANKDQLCNHGCGNLSHSVAQAWGAGHLQLMTEGQRMLRHGVVMRKDVLDLTGNEGWTIMNFDFSASLASIQEMAALRKQLTGNIYAYAGKACSESEVAAFLIGIEEGMFLQCPLRGLARGVCKAVGETARACESNGVCVYEGIYQWDSGHV